MAWDCPEEHRGPEGPNEDIGVCGCGRPTWTMRPANEQHGLHLPDCSLSLRHPGRCIGGGSGHAPVETVRGWWGPTTEEDIAAARQQTEEEK